MATSLVTGGAGFIGSHIVDALLARGDEVRVLDNLSTGKLENLAHVKQKIDFIQADLTDAAAVAKAVQGVDCIFHKRHWPPSRAASNARWIPTPPAPPARWCC